MIEVQTTIINTVESALEPVVFSANAREEVALVVADGAKALGVIQLKDIVKGGIKERFVELRRMGIRTIMITGDNRLTAAAIAAEAEANAVIQIYQGLRTADIYSDGTTKVSTREMGDAVVAALNLHIFAQHADRVRELARIADHVEAVNERVVRIR